MIDAERDEIAEKWSVMATALERVCTERDEALVALRILVDALDEADSCGVRAGHINPARALLRRYR